MKNPFQVRQIRQVGEILGFISAVALISLPVSATENYMKSRGPCKVCDRIEAIAAKAEGADEGTAQSKAVVELGRFIKEIKLTGQSVETQRREIYYALRAGIDLMGADFDGETGLGLLDLREQNRKEFDYVFERFPLAKQKAVLTRFNALFERDLRKKRPLPIAHEVPDAG